MEDAACCLWTDVSVALQLGDNGRTMRRKNNGINIGINIGIGIGIGKAGLLPGVALIFPLCRTLSIVVACILDFLILSTILHTLRCVAQRRRLGSNLYFIFGDLVSCHPEQQQQQEQRAARCVQQWTLWLWSIACRAVAQICLLWHAPVY